MNFLIVWNFIVILEWIKVFFFEEMSTKISFPWLCGKTPISYPTRTGVHLNITVRKPSPRNMRVENGNNRHIFNFRSNSISMKTLNACILGTNINQKQLWFKHIFFTQFKPNNYKWAAPNAFQATNISPAPKQCLSVREKQRYWLWLIITP